ncbi:MAG: VTT domain-containing protein [Verrucomicrobia bacterium]|nr:VTT domain-containing protein [Verrucomicrobiota bacterium]
MNRKHLVPFVVLILLMLIVYVTDLHQELSLGRIREYQHKLVEFVQVHQIIAPVIFILFYVFSVCLILPDSTILSLVGGLVFPLPLAIIYIVVAETIGGTIFFAILYNVLEGVKPKKPFLKKMRQKFQQHQISYLLFLRFSHVLPFWLTNVCAAYFKVSLRTFVWTCFVGVIPLSLILADAGHSLSVLFSENKFLTLTDIFTTEIKIALFVLGLLALAPIVYQNWRKKRK